jgi:Ricin-type beta-trefoil lectin domain
VLRVLCVGVLLAGVACVIPATAGASTAEVRGQQLSEQCQSNASPSQRPCSFATEVQLPLALSVSAGAIPENGQRATVTWKTSCSVNGLSYASAAGSASGATPFHTALTLPKSESGDCTINASVTLDSTGTLTATLNYTLGHQVMLSVPTDETNADSSLASFMCLTDSHQGRAVGAAVVLNNCNSVYVSAWTYSSDRLTHGGLCLTDPRDGWIRTKLVLEPCTGAADQTWTFHDGQEGGPFTLKSNGLCLDDPKYSQRVGTQLIVFSCNKTDEQIWALS